MDSSPQTSKSLNTRRKRVWLRGGLVFASLLVAIYGSICIFLWATQIEQILHPIPETYPSPKERNLPSEPVKIPIPGSDSTVDGYWIYCEDPSAPTLLYLHGQEATIGKNPHHADIFHYKLHCNVLIIDYRGFGNSFQKFRPNEQSLYEDAQAALQYLVDQKIPPERLFIYGHSLGGAVAIELAKRSSIPCAGLIVESTFTSILEMSSLRYDGWLKYIPVDFLLTERFDSIEKIEAIQIPVLFIHGESDEKVPAWMTKKLHEKRASAKEICLIPKAGHENCCQIDETTYVERFSKFLNACMKAPKSLPAPVP